MPRHENLTLVIYDISDDRTRTKVSDACLDYGLVRIQYSAFEGLLSSNRRDELALVLSGLLHEQGGKVALIPICERDLAARIDLDISGSDGQPPSGPLRVYQEPNS